MTTSSHSVPVAQIKSASFSNIIKVAVFFAVIALIGNDMLGGAIKFYTAKASLVVLSYAPILFAGVTVAGYFIVYGAALRVHQSIGLFFVLFLCNAIYALFIGREPGAVAFGLYIWLPFFLGMLMALFKQEDALIKYATIWWAVATTGVLINTQMEFPWIGETYQAFGQTVETSRQWTSFGFDRIAGFARASFSASNQIAVFCIIILCQPGSALKKFIIWGVSMTAIYYTTSKTTLFVMIIVPLLISLIRWTYYRKDPEKVPGRTRKIAFLTLTALSAVVVCLPIFFLTTRADVATSGSVGFFTLSTLYDRMSWMWPDAWNLLLKEDNPITILFGRGVGGIGVSQWFFENLYRNSADNFFVYLYVSLGVGSFLFLYTLLKGPHKWATENQTEFLILFSLAAEILVNGIASNIVESMLSLLVVGLVIGKYFIKAPAAKYKPALSP